MAKNNFNKSIKKYTKGQNLPKQKQSNNNSKTEKYKKTRHLTNLNRGTYLTESFSILKIILLVLLIASVTSFLFSGNVAERTFYDFFNYLFTFPGVPVDWLLNANFLSIDGTAFGDFLSFIGLDFLFNALTGIIKLIILLVTLVLNAFSFLTHLLLYFI